MIYEKNWKKNQKEFRFETVIKRKGDELYVKCYVSSFNTWIYEKDIAI